MSLIGRAALRKHGFSWRKTIRAGNKSHQGFIDCNRVPPVHRDGEELLEEEMVGLTLSGVSDDSSAVGTELATAGTRNWTSGVLGLECSFSRSFFKRGFTSGGNGIWRKIMI